MGWLRPRQMATLLLGAAKVVIGLCHPLAFQEPRAAPILLHIVFSECPGMGKTTAPASSRGFTKLDASNYFRPCG